MKRLFETLKSFQRGWQGYFLSVVLVGLATWLKLLAEPNIIPANVPILYLVAIVPTAIFFGLGPAILTCILSVLAFDYYFLLPISKLNFLDISNAPILVIFLLVGVLFSVLSSNLRKKNLIASQEIARREKLEDELFEYQSQLEDQVKQRTAELKKANLELQEDIKERENTEEALKRNQELLRLAQLASKAGVWQWDLASNENSWSDELFSVYGLDLHSVKPSYDAWLATIHPDDRDTAANAVKLAAANSKELHVEYRVIDRDRTIRWLMSRGMPQYDTQGKAVKYIGIVIDVTQSKKIEQEMQKIARLESLGNLAGGIAHDFNNILTAILGNISLVQAQTEDNPQLTEPLQEAEKASMRARELTQQLLTFSRGGAPVKNIISLTDLIGESVSFALRGSRVKAEFAIAEALWAVDADEGQISQVVHNLVKNAVEAMPEGGVVQIIADNILIAETNHLPLARGNYVQVDIADSGTGVNKENLPHMFEPFFTTKPKGSGLGLATSYSIVKNHGGHINLDSEQGKGAIFHIYLPASKKRALVKKEELEHQTIAGNGNILVMDDDDMIKTMLNSVLTLAGYRVTAVNDGVEAIEKYNAARESGDCYDAVIMDLTIPGGMGGREAMKKLLEIDRDVKVIVSSGYSTDPIMSDYKKYGFSAVVDKPYTAEKIEKTLRDVLKKKQQT